MNNLLINQEEILNLPSTSQIPIKCPVCNNEFTRRQTKVKKELKAFPNKIFYCGISCMNKSHLKPKIKLNCYHCNNGFELKKHEYTKRLKKNIIPIEKWCCSFQCACKSDNFHSPEKIRKIKLKLQAFHGEIPLDLQKQIKELIDLNLSYSQISQKLKISKKRLATFCKNNNLRSMWREYKGVFLKSEIQYKICKICSKEKELNGNNFYIKKNKAYNKIEYYGYCKLCINKSGTEKQKARKIDFIKYKGGKCYHCGLKSFPVIYDFHHIDPNQKEFNLSDNRYYPVDKLKLELDKTVLLCCLCHRLVHSGDITLNTPKI